MAHPISVFRTIATALLLVATSAWRSFAVDPTIASDTPYILDQHNKRSAQLRRSDETPPLQLQTPQFEMSGAIPRTVFEQRYEQLVNQNYRPTWIQGSPGEANDTVYSSIWLRDGEENWRAYYDLTSEEYGNRIENYDQEGYRLICVGAYPSSTTARFAGVWVYEPDAEYKTAYDLSAEEYESFRDLAVETGYAPRVIVGYAEDDEARYACLFEPDSGDPWVARHDLPADEWDASFADYVIKQRYRLLSATVYQVRGETFYAPILVKDDFFKFAEIYHNAPAQEIFGGSESIARNTDFPISISAYGPVGDAHFEVGFLGKERKWRKTGEDNPAMASLDAVMKTLMQSRGIHGAALAVTYKSRLVYACGYNWDVNEVDTVYPDTLFRTASVGKSFTSAAIMTLVEDGKLRLSDRVTSLLLLTPPTGQTADSRLGDVTVQRLLNHLGGWDRDLSGDLMFLDFQIAEALGVPLPIDRVDIMTYATGRKLDHTPGTAFAYSNYGYMLLGKIIEKVSGIPYGEYVQKRVLSPLRISRMRTGNTLFEMRRPGEGVCYPNREPLVLWESALDSAKPRNVMLDYGAYNIENVVAAGGWLASAVDIARFTTAFDETGGYPVLSPVFVQTTFAKPEIPEDFGEGAYYACGWFVTPTDSGLLTEHSGDLPGVATGMVRIPNGLNAVVMFNHGNSEPLGEIPAAVYYAVAAIEEWPSHDLFPKYGILEPDLAPAMVVY